MAEATNISLSGRPLQFEVLDSYVAVGNSMTLHLIAWETGELRSLAGRGGDCGLSGDDEYPHTSQRCTAAEFSDHKALEDWSFWTGPRL